MKTAISIPDNVYDSAEELAERLGTSRSKLYTQAITNYVAHHSKEGVTTKLNAVYTDTTATVEEPLATMQRQSLVKESW